MVMNYYNALQRLDRIDDNLHTKIHYMANTKVHTFSCGIINHLPVVIMLCIPL